MESPLSKKLNTLLTANYDAERGYKEAAEDVNSPKLKMLFQEFAQQRYDFGHQLKREIKSFGADIDKGTSLKADIHRVWMDLKSAVSTNDEVAILTEVIRGEKDAIERYDDVLAQSGITEATRMLIAQQQSQIQAAVKKIKALESHHAAS